MDTLAQLGVALGLASLAGVNLYLTVLVTGLAVRFNFLQLASSYHSLDVLAHPVVIIVAGLLFVMQFFADKIPWVDSLWDSVHTVIRPVGATLLALQVLGTMPGYVKVAAALLAGGAALTTHSAKAATRLLINHSPEPVTNVTMSLAEEAGVAGGVVLTMVDPVLALIIFSVIIAVIWMIYPRLWRLIRTTMWLVWHKLKLPGRLTAPEVPVRLKPEIDHELRGVLQISAGLSEEEVAWTVRCLSGRAKGVRGFSPNLSGILVAPSRADCVYFAANKGWRNRLFKVPLAAVKVEVESKFLSENVVVAGDGLRAVFRFPRGQFATAEAAASRIRESLETRIAPPLEQLKQTVAQSPPAPVAPESPIEPVVIPPPVAEFPTGEGKDGPAPERTADSADHPRPHGEGKADPISPFPAVG